MIDRDILFHLAQRLYQLMDIHKPRGLRSLIEAALLERAKETVALHVGCDDPESWPYQSLYYPGDPLTHWEVTDISQAGGCCIFGEIGPHIHFPACGCGEDGDLDWEVGTIDEAPVTCQQCLDLIVRAGALAAAPIRFRQWM